MASKAFYYRFQVADHATGELVRDADGNAVVETVGPLASDGDWPSIYARRGLFLQPPGSEPESPSDAWHDLWADVLEEGYTLDDARAWLEEALTEPEERDLGELTREQLNEQARALGVNEPEKLQNKGEVIAAIEAMTTASKQ